jgi:hypothetical protein
MSFGQIVFDQISCSLLALVDQIIRLFFSQKDEVKTLDNFKKQGQADFK